MGKSGWRFVVLAVAFAFALTGSASAQNEWVTVSAGDGALHYTAPSEPKITTNDAKDGDTPYTITLYVSSVPGFMVIGSYTVYHADNVEVDPDLVVGGFVKGFNGELVSTTPMPYERGPNDTLKGVMAVAKSTAATCRFRVVAEGVKAYTVAACALSGNDSSADVDRVLSSISITKP